ncbi:MAG TPA: homoserine O-succinyltransferase [Vicinamibacterales bacterium]|nr:homoserine O-succinyltransferase [Vicinamibacterales bacterium]
MAAPIYIAGSPLEWRDEDSACLDIGLINNMPDPALQPTERQFRSLLGKAVPAGFTVRLAFFGMPEIPRTDVGANRVRRLYFPLDELWTRRIDGLIVTGTEPRTPALQDEPYWPALTHLLDWARDHTESTILSCLAAHAAVLHLDGIERRPLANKRFGIFECKRASHHELTLDGPMSVPMPHSRWNEIPEDQLAARGYRVLTRSDEAGADAFVKDQGSKSLFVFLQGHPEYEADTLLLEYRRDVRRYLAGERQTYPELPHGYFDDETAQTLSALQCRAETDRREELMAVFPTELALRRVTNSWRPAAVAFYRSWLTFLRARKDRRIPPATRPARLSQTPAQL